jgi:hypothetical protein
VAGEEQSPKWVRHMSCTSVEAGDCKVWRTDDPGGRMVGATMSRTDSRGIAVIALVWEISWWDSPLNNDNKDGGAGNKNGPIRATRVIVPKTMTAMIIMIVLIP